MAGSLQFPLDEMQGDKFNVDAAADYLELAAFSAESGQVRCNDIIDAEEIAAEAEYADVNDEIVRREDAVYEAIYRLQQRHEILSDTYPFRLVGDNSDILQFNTDWSSGQSAYLISLLISNLPSASDIMSGVSWVPDQSEIVLLRNRYFQYIATAAFAAEIGGHAWSFGWPRPDSSRFLPKLQEIWTVIKDGKVSDDESYSSRIAKDGEIDIFAAKMHSDGFPGFLLGVAQVATGNNWRDKKLDPTVNRWFKNRWFVEPPITDFIPYMIIPFARPDHQIRDDVGYYGNFLYRMRIPQRVKEAEYMVGIGYSIETFDLIDEVTEWLKCYQSRISA